ncbi:MAG: glycoside hydrolase family 3 protein, partial [Candidatus Omnitrophica bacterium]|nr:glycoside hydrolase family 3 protein [Candidatus Omnitrophota bacterium]
NDTLGRAVWVMVDHEGGRVIRFAKGVTRFPDALTVGATQKLEEVVRQGALEAQELRRLGVHVNLAPCVDALVEGADPVIGTRSYGSDPHRVAALATARIQGMQTHGLAACAKHFPGLGAVPKDPHKHLPTVGLEWAAMRQTHLIPFAAAIQAGVSTIMSSHVCYPKLDPSNVPATWSARLIRELLREELKFQGLVLTDDMEMGALHQLAPIGDAAVRAVAAGHDVVLVCWHPPAQRQVFESLRAAYLDGRLSVKELERSIDKITTLRQQLNLT